MNRFLLCFLFLIAACYQPRLRAENNIRLPDIRSLGAGRQEVTLSPVWNPALLPYEEKRNAGIQYYNKYGLKELSSLGGSFIYPNKLLSAGVCFASFGYDKYRESMFRIVFGKQLLPELSLGIGVQYYSLQTVLFDERPAFLSTDIGVSYIPSGEVSVCLLIVNVPSIDIGSESFKPEKMTDKTIEIGVNWNIVDNMLLMGKLAYPDTAASFNASAGMEYTAFNAFFIRAGLQALPFSPSFGLGYRHNMTGIDVVAVSHPLLGYSTGIGLNFYF